MRKTVMVTSGYPQEGMAVLVRQKHQGQALAQDSTDSGRQPICRG